MPFQAILLSNSRFFAEMPFLGEFSDRENANNYIISFIVGEYCHYEPKKCCWEQFGDKWSNGWDEIQINEVNTN
jgi:hypothetical protein